MRIFHQNESCLFVLSSLHNSREGGARKAALIVMKRSHFDRTPQWFLGICPKSEKIMGSFSKTHLLYPNMCEVFPSRNLVPTKGLFQASPIMN